MSLSAWADRYAVVTGASSGIGAEFARQLAARGLHLVLAARREDRLQALAKELADKHGTRCEIIPGDLADPAEAGRLYEEVVARELDVALLINNAGFGDVGTIEETDLARSMGIVQVNIAALTELTYRFLGPMLERGDGGILNVASVAAFQAIPYMPVYAASKAYVLHLTEALWAETKDSGVRIGAVCPGTTRTEFFDAAGSPGWAEKHMSQSVDQVVKTGLKVLEKRKPYMVSGVANKVLMSVSKVAPRKGRVLEMRRIFKPRRG